MVAVKFGAEENMKPEEIGEKLRLHRLWVDGEEGGARADLVAAYLSGANFTGADLSGATGNGKEIKSAQVHTYGLVWTKDVLWIGCQCKTLDEWELFDPLSEGMDEEDCAAWEAHKDWIFETMRRFPAE